MGIESIRQNQNVEGGPEAIEAPRTIDECRHLDDVFKFIDTTMTGYKGELIKGAIDKVRNGRYTVQIIPEEGGLQKKVHQLISIEGHDPGMHDTAYVEGERPWIICTEWMLSVGASGYTSFQSELGLSLKELSVLEDTAHDMLPSDQDEGIFTITDKNGIDWEVSYGRHLGSGHRPGINKLRFANDESAKRMYGKMVQRYRSSEV